MPPALTPEEVDAYQQFSQECARIEQSLVDPRVKQLPATDTKIDPAQVFQWVLTIKRIFDDKGVQDFLKTVAPELVEKLLAIEKKTDTFLLPIRALLNGMGWGDQGPVPVFGGASLGAPGASGSVPAGKLPLAPCVAPPPPEAISG